MQLTLYTDYSLRVLVYLSLHQENTVTISQISEFYQISRNHLVKVVHNLSLKKHIISSRGKGGGLRLAKHPNLINVGSVVRDTEPNFHIAECFNEDNTNSCSVEPICQLKGMLKQANNQFLAVLDKYSIADIIDHDVDESNIITLDPQLKDILMQTENSH